MINYNLVQTIKPQKKKCIENVIRLNAHKWGEGGKYWIDNTRSAIKLP